ncbi:MAG: hypothetical protein J6T39_02305 [Clostridia bacterium]|nr:hypothetical protein [Clostridia bacterium]
MKKKHSIGKFIVIAVLCAVVAILTIFSFKLPGKSKDSDFVGFARAINYGIEYRGGTTQEYSIQTTSTGKLGAGISASATRIKYLLNNEGYNTNTYQNGDNIVIEFIEDYSPVDIENIINVSPSFSIKTSSEASAEEVVKAKEVDSAYWTTSGSNNLLVINFTEAGAENFATVISSGTAYFYFGDSSQPVSLDVSGASSTGLAITVANADIGKYYASQIEASKYDFSYSLLNTHTISKADATKNVVVLLTLTLCIFALCVALLTVFFKKLGLVGALILFVGLLLQIVLLQAVPETVFTFTSPAMLASLLCLVLGALSIYLIFDKMHKEYKLGKILPASIKFGYNKIWATILDVYVVLLVPAIITYFLGSYGIKQFAMALICGLAVYGVVTLVLTKFLSKWLTYISTKNIDYGFKREAHVDELK